MNSLGRELIRVQFFNYGTLSEPLPSPPTPPFSGFTPFVSLPLFLNHLMIWQQLFVIWKRKSSRSYCFPLETPALLWWWLHLINVLHSRCPSPILTRVGVATRKHSPETPVTPGTQACSDWNAICKKAWKRAGLSLKEPQPRALGPPTSHRLRPWDICFGKFGHFSELISQPQN